MTRHTNSPWFVNGRHIGPEAVYEHSSNAVVATPERADGVPTEQDTANARLIAAAPDMYTALQAIADMRVDEGTRPAELVALCMAIAAVAIGKAEGR